MSHEVDEYELVKRMFLLCKEMGSSIIAFFWIISRSASQKSNFAM
jgi:hypothetical protein